MDAGGHCLLGGGGVIPRWWLFWGWWWSGSRLHGSQQQEEVPPVSLVYHVLSQSIAKYIPLPLNHPSPSTTTYSCSQLWVGSMTSLQCWVSPPPPHTHSLLQIYDQRALTVRRAPGVASPWLALCGHASNKRALNATVLALSPPLLSPPHTQGTDTEACAWCGKSSFLGSPCVSESTAKYIPSFMSKCKMGKGPKKSDKVAVA